MNTDADASATASVFLRSWRLPRGFRGGHGLSATAGPSAEPLAGGERGKMGKKKRAQAARVGSAASHPRRLLWAVVLLSVPACAVRRHFTFGETVSTFSEAASNHKLLLKTDLGISVLFIFQWCPVNGLVIIASTTCGKCGFGILRQA